MSMNRTIAVDFDGCICVNEFPEIGKPQSRKIYAHEYWDDRAVIVQNDKVYSVEDCIISIKEDDIHTTIK